LPAELSDAKFLLLVDSTSGGMLGVTLFDNEEAMRGVNRNGREFADLGYARPRCQSGHLTRRAKPCPLDCASS